MSIRFVAEISSNWRAGTDAQSKKRALELIKQAARHGATDVKFQLFRADLMTRNPNPALRSLELPVGWLSELHRCAEDNGVQFGCSPFYVDAVRELYPFVSEYKVASWEITHVPLLEAIRDTDKNVVMSTGAAIFPEVDEALEILRPETDMAASDFGITLLHCTGGYPTRPEDLTLRRVLDLGDNYFPLNIGLSSHCIVPEVTAAAVLYQASMFEVHFDLEDRKGVENGHSYTPETFAKLVKYANLFKEAMDCQCEFTEDDLSAREQYRRDPSDWLRPYLGG